MKWKYGRTHKIVDRGCGYWFYNGYVYLNINGRKVSEHVYIVEQVLGKPLPKGAEIHHVNEIRSDNRKTNLVVCPDHAYHMEIHQRMKELGYTNETR